MGHTFWVWPCLGGGTTSLKFRQFKSAVCDAFGVIYFFFFFLFWRSVGVWFALWGVGVLGLLHLAFWVV